MNARELVPVILAVALSLALNLIALAALWAVIDGQALSADSGRALASLLGGVLTLLGSIVGYRAGRDR